MAAESLRLDPATRRLTRRAFGSAALVGSLLATPVSHAQTVTAVSATAAEPPADTAVAALPDPAAEEPGAALYQQAEARYVAGDVAGALELMQRSYDTSSKPELLYNLGELHRELGHCTEARESYERYLALAQNGTRRSEAERKAKELVRECPDATPSSPPPASAATTPPPADDYWTPARIVGWSSIGASVVFATTAAYFIGRSATTNSAYQAILDSPVYTKDGAKMATDGYRYNALAWGLGGAAVGLGAFGVSLLVLNPRKHPSAAQGISVRISADGASAGYRGSF
jgi:hypothetical protein